MLDLTELLDKETRESCAMSTESWGAEESRHNIKINSSGIFFIQAITQQIWQTEWQKIVVILCGLAVDLAVPG